MKLLAALVAAIALAGNAAAQVDTAWVRNLSGPTLGLHSGNSIWSMPDGGAVIAGEVSSTNGKTDLIVSRYSPDGDLRWSHIVDGPIGGTDAGRFVRTDSPGHVYVAGTLEYEPGKRHVLLLKYSSDGDLEWSRTMEVGDGGGISDSVTAMCLDRDGNVILAGMTNLSIWNLPIFVRKHAPDGAVLWHRTYEFIAYPGTYDVAHAVECDDENNVYVAGAVGYEDWNYLTIKYSPAGQRLWLRIFETPWREDDLAHAIAVDKQGSVCVTGTSVGETGSVDYLTVKYDSLGNVLWTRRFIGSAGGTDIAIGIGVDDAGAVYVGGQTRGFFTLEDFHVIKYESGSLPVWDRQYTGPGFSVDIPSSFRVSASGVTYISGASGPNSSSWEFATISYDSAGFLNWRRRYGGNITDSAMDMHLDISGNVYVTGKGRLSGSAQAITSIRYAPCSPPAVVEPPQTSNAMPCSGNPFTLTWGSSPGATTYELYEDGAFVSTGSDTSRTIVRDGGPYSYTVRARHSECGSAAHSAAGGFTTTQCQCRGDANCDGATDIIDVTASINEAFRGIPNEPDDACSNRNRYDVDCDCAVSITDVVAIVSVAFRGVSATAVFCDPCAMPCP